MVYLKEIAAKLKAYVFARKLAYQFVFNKENVYTKTVLADLAKFCRANQSTFHTNQRAHAVLEGRREVWLRITQHLHLSNEELWNLTKRSDINE